MGNKLDGKGNQQMHINRYASMRRRSKVVPASCLVIGLLISLQFLLPSIAFANTNASRDRNGHALSQQQQEALDLASVSVVRLVVTYNAIGTNPQPSVATCTGLGSLVGSWSPRNITDANNWVLTDSSLVHLSGATCTGKAGQLFSITIFPNTTYTNTQSVPQPLGQLLCSPSGCHDGATGTGATETITPAADTPGGGAIFSFHTDAQHVQPFLDVAPFGSNTAGTQLGIELANTSPASGKWPPSPLIQTNEQPPAQYLVPNPITFNTSNAPGNSPTSTASVPAAPLYEPGMPVVGVDGTLIGMYLSGNGQNQLTLIQISDLMRTQLDLQPVALAQFKQTNLLYKNWVAGITDYYNHDYRAADTALKAIASTNSEFQAARIFDTMKIVPRLQGSGNGGSPAPENTGNATILGLPAQLVILVGVIVGLIILILLLVLMSLTFRRARVRRRRELVQFKVDQADAQRMAEMEAQHQQPKITTRFQSPSSMVHCPNCGVQVTANHAVCPNCHYLLSAPDSGLHLRAVPPTVSPPPPTRAQTANPPRVSKVEPTADAFVQPETVPATTNDLKSVPSQQCPRCGQEVPTGAVYCPRCRYQLVSSAPAATSDTSSMVSLEAGVVGKAADNERPAPGIAAPQPIPAKPAVQDNQVAQALLLRLWERADRNR